MRNALLPQGIATPPWGPLQAPPWGPKTTIVISLDIWWCPRILSDFFIFLKITTTLYLWWGTDLGLPRINNVVVGGGGGRVELGYYFLKTMVKDPLSHACLMRLSQEKS